MQNEFSALKSSISQMVNLEEPAWEDMKDCLQIKSVQKKGIFQAAGKICREVAFINKGSFRYYHTIDGKEESTFFCFENEWITSYSSFISQRPGNITIEAMEAATILVLGYADMQLLFKKHPSLEKFGRLMAEYTILCLEERMYNLLLKTPQERYLKSLADNRQYYERVPLHYIASYLGIAPESLSRIRKKIMQ